MKLITPSTQLLTLTKLSRHLTTQLRALNTKISALSRQVREEQIQSFVASGRVQYLTPGGRPAKPAPPPKLPKLSPSDPESEQFNKCLSYLSSLAATDQQAFLTTLTEIKK